MKVIDLFCGAGGLSIGLATVGLETIIGIDLDKDSIQTYGRSHPTADAICGDVETTVEKLSFDPPVKRSQPLILVGGPPCQGFCSINPSRDVADPRNSCVDMYLRAAEKIKPDLILMENVTGLLSLGKGFAKKKLQETLSNLGYVISYKVLQAAHYGVPQNRWRLIIIASKIGNFNFPEPTHHADIKPNIAGGKELTFSVSNARDLFTELLPSSTVWDAISDLPRFENGEGSNVAEYTCEPASNLQRNLRINSARIYNHLAQNVAEINYKRIKHIKEGENWQSLPNYLIPSNIRKSAEKWGRYTPTRFGRLRRDGLFTTILTKPEPYWGSFIHPIDDRLISVREAARAQTFPDSVIFQGKLGSQYRQVGNAVPVVLGQAMGKSILDHFSRN